MLFTYFKGWYFKCVSENQSIAFIPAVHSDGLRKTASLQIITHDTVLNIPFENMECDEDSFIIDLDKCRFSKKGIYINIKRPGIRAVGRIKFGRFRKIRYDAMGPFKYLPLMECRHSIVSMKHTLKGDMVINGKKYCFDGGTGYIEGDRGYSFPRQYMWTQCTFSNGSVMLCTGDVRIGCLGFTGIICVIIHGGREYRLATYLGAQAEFIGHGKVIISQGRYRFTAVLDSENAQKLSAPVNGSMCRKIRENIRCKAHYIFEEDNIPVFRLRSDSASFEYEYGR